MKNSWLLSLLSLVLFSAVAQAAGTAVSPPPSLIIKNRFGEQSYNYVLGGSNSIDLIFRVDPSNVNGLGISGLKGENIANVYMHTSATPAVGNPNPAAGYLMIQMVGNYAAYLSGYHQMVGPNSGTPINVTTGVTAGLAYVIQTVGTTTAAGFQALGLQPGLTPTVGQAFIAIATTTATGTGTIEVPAAAGSGNLILDVVGEQNLSAGATTGTPLLMRFLAPTSPSVTTLVATAPVDQSIVKIKLSFQALPNSLK